MIRLLSGIIHHKEDRALVLLVNGVGYHVFVPSDLLALEGEVTVHVHTHVREDQITLFGFRSAKELAFFELLLTINGVGPKMALEILNQPPEHIQNAIFTGNVAALTKISGVGKKIAERIILELKSKVEPGEDVENAALPEITLNEDILVSLESLGYKRHHIKKVLSTMEEDSKSEEEIVRFFLQNV